ncbi:MAG: hypothetical protein ACLQD8_03995 [Thermoplasmata archaeon]
MLRLLGVRIIPRTALIYLILAVVCLGAGMLLHAIGVELLSGPLSLAGVLLIAVGILGVLLAARRASSDPGN